MTASLTPFLLYGGAGICLVSMGLYALAVHTHIYRRILAWNALGSGIFLFLGAVSSRNAGSTGADPLPQAVVITGIVVSVSATALALAIARRIRQLEKKGGPDADS